MSVNSFEQTGFPGYVCPRTKIELMAAKGRLESSDGSISYPIVNGIPNLLHYESVESDASEAQLEQLNQIATERGWRSAIDSCYEPAMVNYVTDTRRASFMSLLPLSSDSIVLEIGCGLGQFSPSLAKKVRWLSALEVVSGQARFAAERCKQEGVTNADFAIGGDDCNLPYPESAFDTVVLNLVFEWCGNRCTDEPHPVSQSRMLSEICRVLKPGGSLYLTTKNRLSLHYLLGKRDEHTMKMRFGSALPRWVCSFFLKASGQGRPPGYLHSYSALALMLKRSGFDVSATYWAAPEMRFPKMFVKSDADSIRAVRQQPGFIQGDFRSTRLIMSLVPARLVKHVTQGLTFVARKPVADAAISRP